MSFADQLARGRTGDPAAQEALFGRWRSLLRLQARKLLGPELAARVDPSDVVQESLLQASRDLATFQGTTQGEWVKWLQRLVAGHAANTRRHHHAQRRTVDQEEARTPPEVPDRRANLVARLIEAEEAARLAEAVDRLPDRLREVLVRRMLDEEPLTEVARGLQLTPRVCRGLLARALQELGQLLESEAANGPRA
jgi:RNA polymerase sigma-70 factor (ECF subfamily)